jgi:hypothetical protein
MLSKDNPCHWPAHGTPPISLLQSTLEQVLLLFALPIGRVLLLQIIHHLLFLICKESPFVCIEKLHRNYGSRNARVQETNLIVIGMSVTETCGKADQVAVDRTLGPTSNSIRAELAGFVE